jgi:hypothetical protein
LRAPRLKPFDQAADVVIAAEIDRRVLFLKGEQSGKRRARRVPGKSALGIERYADEFALKAFEAALAIAHEIERLDVGRNESLACGRLDRRENRLAKRTRLGELGEAPFRSQPVRRLNNDDGLRLLDLAVERPLPVRPWRDAGRFVLVEES